jgi:hypothetical protein
VTDVVDLRVTIERVRVHTGARDVAPGPAFVTGHGGSAGAAPGDHRIVIHQLCIDVEAELDEARARSLGKQVASDLADQLAALQAERLPRITASPDTGGPIHIETLRLYLRGEPARHPSSREICAALMTAFEQRVRHAA